MNKTKIVLMVSIIVVVATLTIPRFMIRDHYACSDYCPGPEEQYIVKVYPVYGEIWCRLVGGEPQTYYGWGKFSICAVKHPSKTSD